MVPCVHHGRKVSLNTVLNLLLHTFCQRAYFIDNHVRGLFFDHPVLSNDNIITEENGWSVTPLEVIAR